MTPVFKGGKDKTGRVASPGSVAFMLRIVNQQSNILQGLIVQNIVSLTNSIRGQLVKCFTTIIKYTDSFC